LVALGFILSVGASVRYGYGGWDALVGIALVLGLFVTWLGFRFGERRGKGTLHLQDLVILTGIVLLFAPVYLFRTYAVPWQVNTDEVTISLVERAIVSSPPIDPLGTSDYFGFPTLVFLLFGKIGEAIGGITLANMRIVHAGFGILTVALAYLCFRVWLPRFEATLGTIILGSHHALVAISRMAMRDVTGLTVLLGAFAVLGTGLKRRSLSLTFLGGAVGGLSFYTYYPGRVTMVVWLLFLMIAGVSLSRKISRQFLSRSALIAIGACVVVAAPVLTKTYEERSESMPYQREQILLFPEGRSLEQQWTGAATPREAVLVNIRQGLTFFWNEIHDQGYIYPNYGNGFFDPLSGMLVLLGLTVAILGVARRRTRSGWLLLSLTGFSAIWLTLTFFTTKAPNYTRLLVLLPFSSSLILLAASRASAIVGSVSHRFVRRRSILIERTAASAIVAWIVLANLCNFSVFALKGAREGNDVGGTGRYIEARGNVPGYTFYLASDHSFPYYSWGEAWQWKSWMDFFTGENQRVEVVDPAGFIAELGPPPFTVFMNRKLFNASRHTLENRFPVAVASAVTADGRLVAVEVKE
jgi:hypothetical protein